MKLTKFFAFALAALAFVGCDTDTPGGGGGDKPTGDAVLVANNNSVEVNTPIEFTVTASDGSDLTSEAIIYDKSHDYVVVEEGDILMICPREDVATMRRMHTDTKFM